jgi:hypothetical protein
MLANTLNTALTTKNLEQVSLLRIEITAEVLNHLGIRVVDGTSVEKSANELQKLPALQQFQNITWGITYKDWDKPEGEQGLDVAFSKDNPSLGQRFNILFTMHDGHPQVQINGVALPQLRLN